MTTLLAVDDTIQTTIWNQLGEQASLNVLYWQVTATVGAPTLEGIADDFDDDISAIFTPCMSQNGSHLGSVLRRVAPTASAMVLSDHGFAPGAVASEPLGNQVAALTTKRTALPGPSGRGRIYWGILPKTFAIDGLDLTAAAKVIVQAQSGLLLLPLSVGPMGNSVTLRLALYEARPVPFTKLVTSMVARTKLATQRRRGGTGRPNVSPF